MPKQKTHKGIAKRFKLTATGKVKHRSPGRGHLLSGKTAKRKRQLRSDTVLTTWETTLIAGLLRPQS